MNYLVLINLATKDKSIGNVVMSNLAKISKQPPKPIWFDDAHVGVVLETQCAAIDIWQAAANGRSLPASIKDLLVVELARDWCGRNESPGHGWLNSHLGAPLSSTFRKG